MQKETIYFLEWLSQETGFTENQLLENMRPENQRWSYAKPYKSINEFLETTYENNYCSKIFKWDSSILKSDEFYWKIISSRWIKLTESNKYNIEFSRYPIEDWKIVKSPKKIKVKSKLKI
jgi:hypothetical protein